MNEKEIIKFLKNNKTTGIAFKFMPDEVKKWLDINIVYSIHYSFMDKKWIEHKSNDYDHGEALIYSLPDNFEEIRKKKLLNLFFSTKLALNNIHKDYKNITNYLKTIKKQTILFENQLLDLEKKLNFDSQKEQMNEEIETSNI